MQSTLFDAPISDTWDGPLEFIVKIGPGRLVHSVKFERPSWSVVPSVRHFEFRGPEDGMSETGYFSQFMYISEEFDSPVEYARAFAEHVYAERFVKKRKTQPGRKAGVDG